jgi:integrase
MPRRRLAFYGRRRFRVNVFVARGLVCCEWRVRGQRRTKSWPDSPKTREVAKRWAEDYADERRRVQQDRAAATVEPATLQLLWSRYRLARGDAWRPKTKDLYEGWWRDLAAFFGPSLRADALTLDHVDSFRQARRAAGVEHGTIRRTIGFLRQLYNFGEGRDLVQRNRLRAYRYVVAKDERGAEPDEYTRDEIVAIAKALDWPAQWRPRNIIRICGTHGKPVNAVLHLQWADVDFERRQVTWRAAWDKTGTERVTPMTRVSYAALLECYQQRHSSAPWLFWSPDRPQQPSTITDCTGTCGSRKNAQESPTSRSARSMGFVAL